MNWKQNILVVAMNTWEMLILDKSSALAMHNKHKKDRAICITVF